MRLSPPKKESLIKTQASFQMVFEFALTFKLKMHMFVMDNCHQITTNFRKHDFLSALIIFTCFFYWLSVKGFLASIFLVIAVNFGPYQVVMITDYLTSFTATLSPAIFKLSLLLIIRLLILLRPIFLLLHPILPFSFFLLWLKSFSTTSEKALAF